jgi:signal transduction histidine kinase
MMAGSPGRPGQHRIAEEQAALRRLAVLVAAAAPSDEVFTAITEEAGRLLGVGRALLSRYDPDGTVSVVAAWSSAGAAAPVGTKASLGGLNVHTLVFQTGREARLDDYSGVSGDMARLSGELGLRGVAGVPVSAGGRLWGVMVVASVNEQPLPADTEKRLAEFTELAATAIANAQARTELRAFAEEQAALRRVATLVARGGSPEEVFAVVAEEAGQLLGADVTGISRYDPDGMAAAVGGWARTGGTPTFPVGTSVRLGGRNVVTLVSETARPARIDKAVAGTGEPTAYARERGFGSVVGAPITVEGRLWGALLLISRSAQPLPAGTEERLAGFTELAATAIANAQARTELRAFAEEQAALGRVATLVAQGAPSTEVFTAVAVEAGQLLQVDGTVLSRYDPDGMVTVVGAWTRIDLGRPLAVGLRLKPEGRNMHALVFETGRPARLDDYGAASGAFADTARDWEFRASVGVPIRVEGRLWGVMSAASRSEPLPADTEARLAGFTELAATSLGNAEAQAALAASRVRIVAAADQTRRRVERDLHDGAQQRLVALALHLRAAQAIVPPGAQELVEQLGTAASEATGVQEELREISHGLHPAILTESGLRPALRALARRSAVPVSVDVQLPGRLPQAVETVAYHAVFEALANTARHARAASAEVEVAADEGVLRVRVRDDGCGGADFSRGSGLTGLKDRVEAFGGRISLDSPPGAGTTLEITLPLELAHPLALGRAGNCRTNSGHGPASRHRYRLAGTRE